MIKVMHADITTLAVDAIVNAANEMMLGGGGVDGAIHDAAGEELFNACRKVPGVTLGNLLSTEPRSRNALLADIAKRIGLAERTGRGVDKIYEGVLRYGRSLPIYSPTVNEVVLRLPREKADFDFLKYVIESEVRTGKTAKVDFLLTSLELCGRTGKCLLRILFD